MKRSQVLKTINKHLAGEMRRNVTIAGVKNISHADLSLLQHCLMTSTIPNFGAPAQVWKKITQD